MDVCGHAHVSFTVHVPRHLAGRRVDADIVSDAALKALLLAIPTVRFPRPWGVDEPPLAVTLELRPRDIEIVHDGREPPAPEPVVPRPSAIDRTGLHRAVREHCDDEPSE